MTQTVHTGYTTYRLSPNCEVVDLITSRVRRITEVNSFSIKAVDPINGDWIIYPLREYDRAFQLTWAEERKQEKQSSVTT